MNKIITGVIGVVAVLALIISLAMVGGKSQPATDVANFGAEGTRLPNGLSTDSTSPSNGQVRTTTLTVTGTTTAATTTVDTVDIITKGTTSLVTSTTTPWAIQATASSTLTAGFCILTGSTSASTIGLAKSTTNFSTSTVLATTTCAANAQCSINALATTTSNLGLGAVASSLAVRDRYFGPSDRLVFWQEGGAVGDFSPTGACTAQWLAP